MKRPRRRNPVATALYLNAGLLGAVLVALLARGGGFGLTSTANAAPQPNPPAIGVVGNLALMPAQFSSNTWGCYVLDADKRTLCAYQYLPGMNQLRMVAARNFAQDLDLKNWNTGPDLRDILRLTELERNGVRGRGPEAQPQPRIDPVAPDGTTRPADPVVPPPAGDRPQELEPANPGEIEPARPGEPERRGNPG
jgi:hypothetical protein